MSRINFINSRCSLLRLHNNPSSSAQISDTQSLIHIIIAIAVIFQSKWSFIAGKIYRLLRVSSAQDRAQIKCIKKTSRKYKNNNRPYCIRRNLQAFNSHLSVSEAERKPYWDCHFSHCFVAEGNPSQASRLSGAA